DADLDGNDRVTHGADSFDVRFNNVAGPDPFLRRAACADTGRRTGGDDVARLKRDACADVGDQMSHVEQHVTSVGLLFDLAVYLEPQIQILGRSEEHTSELQSRENLV